MTIDVELRPGVVLTGHVVGPDGQPIPHASVVATSVAAMATFELADTNEQGAFRLEGLVPVHYDLSATTARGDDTVPAEPAESLEGKLTDIDVERVHDVTIRTKPALFGAIYGEITGVEPRASVTIHVSKPDGQITVFGEARAGHYRLPKIPIGTVTVQATLEGAEANRWTQPVVVDVVPNSEVRADLHLPESFPIDGRVLRDGVPLIDERIVFTDDSGKQAYASTGEDGTYSADLMAGRYLITVDIYSVERDITGPGTVDIDVDLARIVVAVVDAVTEAPIEDARIYGHDADPGANIIPGGRTNGNGQVKFDLPHGAREIVVEKEGYGTAIVAAPSPPALLVKLTRSKEVAVHIVDARDGRPLSGNLTVHDAGGHVFLQSSEGAIDGRMHVSLNPGRYRFSAWVTGYGSQASYPSRREFDEELSHVTVSSSARAAVHPP